MFGARLIPGLLGIETDLLKVLIHDMVVRLPPKMSTASNLIIGVTALAGPRVYLPPGLIDPGLAAPVILGVVTGAFIGTRMLVVHLFGGIKQSLACMGLPCGEPRTPNRPLDESETAKLRRSLESVGFFKER